MQYAAPKDDNNDGGEDDDDGMGEDDERETCMSIGLIKFAMTANTHVHPY